MSRDYKMLLEFARTDPKNIKIVITREELLLIREKYNKKYSLQINKLEASDVFRGKGLLQGIKLAIGKWV